MFHHFPAANEDSPATDEDLPATESAPEGSLPSTIAINDHQNNNKSPLVHGESKLFSLCVEVKKDHFDIERLKYQLWANMIIITV